MENPYVSNLFYLIVVLYAICCSGTCKDPGLGNKVQLGQTEAKTSINSRKENSDNNYENATSKYESTFSRETIQSTKYYSLSSVSLKNEQSSISNENKQRSIANRGSAPSKQSHDASGSVVNSSGLAWSSGRANSAHSHGFTALGHSFTQSLHSAQSTPSSMMSATMSSQHSTTYQTTARYNLPSYNPSENLSITSQYNAENFTNSLSKRTSSIQSHSSLSTGLDSLILSVSENTGSTSVLLTSALESSATETLSIPPIAPSSSWDIYSSASFSIVSNQSDIKPIAAKGCLVILDGLAEAMGQMTVCLIKHLRPIEVCAKCTKFHSNLRRYENLISNTKNCEKELVLDYNAQYQAVRKMYKVQYDMWQDFECEKCYKDRQDTNPSALWIPKEEFLRSEALVKDIMVCFANYSESKILLPYPVMLNMSNNINGSSKNPARMICTKCRDIYEKLKSYMKSIHIEGSAEKRWCADMVYGFNETRRVWGEFCITHNEDRESIIALTCFFCFLPVVFYIGTKLHSDVKERKNESKVSYDSD